MFQDVGEERRRLAELYREKSDEELLELAAGSGDLTDVAQETLRAEMKARQMSETDARHNGREQPAVNFEYPGRDTVLYTIPPAAGREEDPETEASPEYTWKTQLCECETPEQGWQLSEVLRRAGIDSWVQSPHGSYPRILVAADQLEQALIFAAQPVPQDIVSASKLPPEALEFEVPVCPKCGAADPVLESVDPSNTWQCDVCGQRWTDPADASTDAADNEPPTRR
jgi:hypothetical protein